MKNTRYMWVTGDVAIYEWKIYGLTIINVVRNVWRQVFLSPSHMTSITPQYWYDNIISACSWRILIMNHLPLELWTWKSGTNSIVSFNTIYHFRPYIQVTTYDRQPIRDHSSCESLGNMRSSDNCQWIWTLMIMHSCLREPILYQYIVV